MDDGRARREFEQALSELRAGRAAEAETICRRVIEQHPSDANFQALLGAILLRGGRADEAEEFLRRAIKIAPGFARAHEDLGLALLELGRGEEGIASLEQAVATDPKLESAWVKLGHALAAADRGADADRAFERAFALAPDTGKLAEAADHFLNGRYREAEGIAREVAGRDPNNIGALRLLAKVAMQADCFDDAERLLRRVVAIAPRFIDAWHELAAALREQELPAETVQCLEQAAAVDPDNGHTQYLLASALAQAGRAHDAVEAYQRSLQKRPGHPGALLGLGHVLKTVGRQDDGIRAYREAIAQKPGFGEAWFSLANLKTFRFSDADETEMERAVETPDLDVGAEVHYCFALGKAREDAGDFDGAFAWYERANSKHRMQVAYDPVQTQVINERIRKVFDADLLAQKSGHGCPDPAPIFIVGLPRSGSTLIEQILASHSQVEGTSELPELGKLATSLNRQGGGLGYPEAVRRLEPKELRELGELYMERTRRHRHGRAFFTDKMPNNFPTVGLLHLILPHAKVIDARRHPLDTCLSCYKQHFAKGQTFTYDLVELGEFYLEYLKMMQHWDAVLPGRVLRVQYEEVVADPETQIRRLLEYCGLPWEDACLKFHETERAVRTASSEQVRQPIYTRSVAQWKKFERHLEPLIEVLRPILPD